MKIQKKIDKNIFRGFDIRGIAYENLTVDVAYTIGLGIGSYIQDLGKKQIVVGYDNRESSKEISQALMTGILETGVDIVNIGLVTTPMYYFAWEHLNIYSGVMVTASHNPKEYNGFKFAFDERGNAKGEMIQEFRRFIERGVFRYGQGNLKKIDISKEYLKVIKKGIDLGDKKIKAVVDAGNGTGSIIIKEVFDMFNIDTTYIFCESDSNFPNHHPDPSVEENLKLLKAKVLEIGADIGIAIDGDADRVGIIDEKGQFIPADKYMIIIWRDIINKVKNKTALFDVKCTKALPDEIKKLGGRTVCYRTGNSYMKAMMKEGDFDFGGEFSGHIWFRDKFPGFDDGIYAGLRLVEILSKTDKKVSELLDGINKYYSSPEILIKSTDDLKNIVVEKLKMYVKEKGYNVNEIDGVRVDFDDGWALIRASQTGPNLSVRFEGKTKQVLDSLYNEFMEIIEKENK